MMPEKPAVETAPARDDGAELTIMGAETEDHTVPSDVLVRTLESLQRIVFLVAGAEKGLPIGVRFAMPDRFKEEHLLRCGIPAPSSYALPLSLQDGTTIPGAGAHPLLVRVQEFVKAASTGAREALEKLLPDPAYRGRAVAEVEKMAPRPGNRWSVALAVGGESVELDARSYRAVHRLTAPAGGEKAEMTVTGELIRVDFAKLTLTLRYPPTGREIPCKCDSAVLDSILPNRDEPIQVTGRFRLDADCHPIKLFEVSRIEPLDLSPMTFEFVEWEGRRLEIDPPLGFQPTMDEDTGQLYVLSDDELGIHVFARHGEQLADELAEQLLFLWDSYAKESPDRLTPSASKLRDDLRARIRESNLATA